MLRAWLSANGPKIRSASRKPRRQARYLTLPILVWSMGRRGYRAAGRRAPVALCCLSMRPEILFPLFSPVTSLKGVGQKIAPLVEKVAGPTVRDLIFLSPQSFIRRTPAKAARAIEDEV